MPKRLEWYMYQSSALFDLIFLHSFPLYKMLFYKIGTCFQFGAVTINVDKYTDETKKTPEIHPHIHSHLIYDKWPMQYCGGKWC